MITPYGPNVNYPHRQLLLEILADNEPLLQTIASDATKAHHIAFHLKVWHILYSQLLRRYGVGYRRA